MIRWLKRYKSYIGCCLIVFLHTGINSVAAAAMPQLRIYYEVELSTIIAGASLCSLMMFFGGLIGERLIRRVKPKGAFLIASVFAGIYPLLIFFTDQVWGFYVGCGSIGLTAAWGSHVTSNIYIHRFHTSKAGTLIAALLAVGMLGGSSFQFMSGFLLPRIGLRSLYLVVACAALLAVGVNLLLLDNIPVETPKKDESQMCSTAKTSAGFLWKDTRFWRMLIVTLLGSTLCTVFATLCTTFLQAHGVSTQASASYLSLYTLCAGGLALVGGILADRFGFRIYCCYLYLTYAFAIGCAIWFDRWETWFLIPIMILLFAAASPCGSLYNMLSVPIFGGNALSANTKLMSFGSLGGAVLLPLYTRLYEQMGFQFVWCVLFAAAVLCFGLLWSVLSPDCPHKNEN